MVGAGENMLECQDTSYKYSNLNNVRTEFMNLKKYWNNLINHIQVKTPVESMNIMLNGWLLYTKQYVLEYGQEADITNLVEHLDLGTNFKTLWLQSMWT